jgi:hypothetical protein
MSEQLKNDYIQARKICEAAEAKVKKRLQKHKEYQKAMSLADSVDADSPEALRAMSIVCAIEGTINEQYKMQTIRAHLKKCEDELLSATRIRATKLTMLSDEERKTFQNTELYQRGIRIVRIRTMMLQAAVRLAW